jgi:hypothetical protein
LTVELERLGSSLQLQVQPSPINLTFISVQSTAFGACWKQSGSNAERLPSVGHADLASGHRRCGLTRAEPPSFAASAIRQRDKAAPTVAYADGGASSVQIRAILVPVALRSAWSQVYPARPVRIIVPFRFFRCRP